MRIVFMPFKIRIATFVNDGADDVSEITMEIDRIVFLDNRMKLIRQDAVQAEFPASAVKEIEMIHKPRVEQVRSKHPRAYEPWTTDEEEQLAELHTSGTSPSEIAKQLQRQTSAIRSRLIRLGFAEPAHDPNAEALDYADEAGT
jgi:hypothetical protein